MKKKYTITVAGMDLNVLSEESAEVVEAVVGAIDRRIREINLRSPRCSRTEAALLCALDYCCEKNALTAKLRELEEKSGSIKDIEDKLEELSARLEALTEENAGLSARLAELDGAEQRARELAEALAAETEARQTAQEALSVAERTILELCECRDEADETDEVEPEPEEEAKSPCEVIKAVGEDELAAQETEPEAEPVREQITLDVPAPAAEARPSERRRGRRDAKASRVGDMFDMLSLGDV